MGGACSMHGSYGENTFSILLENLKGRDHAEHRGVYERIILEWILG